MSHRSVCSGEPVVSHVRGASTCHMQVTPEGDLSRHMQVTPEDALPCHMQVRPQGDLSCHVVAVCTFVDLTCSLGSMTCSTRRLEVVEVIVRPIGIDVVDLRCDSPIAMCSELTQRMVEQLASSCVPPTTTPVHTTTTTWCGCVTFTCVLRAAATTSSCLVWAPWVCANLDHDSAPFRA